MRRNCFRFLAFCLLIGASGCEGSSAPPPGHDWQEAAEGPRSITDPKLRVVAEEWRTRVLQQAETAGQQPLFSRAELLPVTMSALPYGVGVYQQQPRLPVILTTGPGWPALDAEQKEKQIALVYKDLSDHLQTTGFGEGCRPALTLQTPRGMLLAWINQVPTTGKRIHGDND
jgi:hypothetical protein